VVPIVKKLRKCLQYDTEFGTTMAFPDFYHFKQP